jgi:hypothetical protein
VPTERLFRAYGSGSRSSDCDIGAAHQEDQADDTRNKVTWIECRADQTV